MNETLLCLILKCPQASMLKNFRPIGLCNTIYKTVTKIPLNRIKPYLTHIIGPSQVSFLFNRRASNNAIIVQEYITRFETIRGKIPHTILKIDLERAFDRIEWSFIRDTLQTFNFLIGTTNFIMCCVNSFYISILVNGDQTTPFKPTRDIRQGDLLSPYYVHGKDSPGQLMMLSRIRSGAQLASAGLVLRSLTCSLLMILVFLQELTRKTTS